MARCSNKERGTIAASTIYHTEEVVSVYWAAATDEGCASVDGIF